MRPTALLLPTIFLATPLMAQDTRFTREMSAGSRLELENINGPMTLTQGSGRTLQVTVTKKVRKGSGDKVRAILEEDNGIIRVCTLDQNNNPDRTTCHGKSDGRGKGDSEDQVEMSYSVTVPAGVIVAATTVNGGISAKAIDRADRLTTVNGTITFTGDAVTSLNTVNGSIEANLASTRWTGKLDMQTVNGSVTVTLPASADVVLRGSTVSGGVHSDFSQVTAASMYGPKSLKGQLGQGGRTLELSTVSGTVSVVKR